jgi:hypothetical protein
LAIQVCADSPILYGNRAAALMKRNWDGDFYAALLDCYRALSLDRMHLKSHFRLVRCLFELKWYQEARQCMDMFVKRFPDYANTNACDALADEINKQLKKLSSEKSRASTTEDESENEYDRFVTKKSKRDNTDDESSTESETDVNEATQTSLKE